MWAEVNFGKWKDKGETLPQILVADAEWFFWAFEVRAFAKYRNLVAEAEMLNRRARSIKVPIKHAPKDTVQYWVTPGGKFARIDLVESTQPPHQGSSAEERRDYLDLCFPRLLNVYDKVGFEEIFRGFKHYWFDDMVFTKKRVEAFFADPTNFLNP